MEDERAALSASIGDRAERLRVAAAVLQGRGSAPPIMPAIDGIDPDFVPPDRPPTVKFLRRADQYLAAQEIGAQERIRLAAGVADPNLADWILLHVGLIVRGRTRTIAGLRYLEEDFFTYWNEASPSETRQFWIQVAEAGLPWVRRDLLAEIFERGRISSRSHYEHAVDSIVIAQQEGLLTPDQAKRLSAMIGAYETRR